MKNRKTLFARCSPRAAAAGPAGARRVARLRLRARMGRAGAGARRQPGRRVGGHHRAAGPAPDPGQAEPDRARAQRRPGGLHRCRTRDRLAAGAAAAIGQRQGAAGPAGQLRGGRLRAQARRAEPARPRAGRRARGRQPAHPDRPAQHRAGGRWRWAPGCSSSTRRMPATTRRAQADFAQRWQQAIARWTRAGRAAEGHAGGVAAQGLRLPVRLARPEGSGRARAQARRRADGVAPAERAGDAEGHAGAHGAVRGVPGPAPVGVAEQERRHSGGEAAVHRRRQRRCEGPVRAVRRHAWRACWPPGRRR